MREIHAHEFRPRRGRGDSSPLWGHLELTYRCNLRCVHCYAAGSEDLDRELSTAEWKDIIRQLRSEGCLSLCLTGGEPLLRADFWELYRFAKASGFLVSVFSNGLLIDEKALRCFKALPPNQIEITLNGITPRTYESITGVAGSFVQALASVKRIREAGLPLLLKANCLRQNSEELEKIRNFARRLLGRRGSRAIPFKYDPILSPRLNGDTLPCTFRLPPEALVGLLRQESQVWRQTQRLFCNTIKNDPPGEDNLLHLCSSWRNGFFINPFGRLKFCMFSQEYSVDLRKTSFRQGFYRVFPRILKRKFSTNSSCRTCRLRRFCYHCPARAALETGSAEQPIAYFCKLARLTEKAMSSWTPR